MFFRPEENAFLSKSIDDVGIFQAAEIHVGDKNNRMAPRFQAAAIHVTVDLHLQGPFAVSTFRVHLNDHLLPPQPPLHEGRCESVHRSGGVQLFPRVEGDPVRGFLHGHRIGPDDPSLFVPNQKSQVFFQILQNILDPLQG